MQHQVLCHWTWCHGQTMVKFLSTADSRELQVGDAFPKNLAEIMDFPNSNRRIRTWDLGYSNLEPPTNMVIGVPVALFPQQRKLMGSSAKISSGVLRCSFLVRFPKVPSKVPEGSGLGRWFQSKFRGRFWARGGCFRSKFRKVPVLVEVQVRLQAMCLKIGFWVRFRAKFRKVQSSW